MWPENLRARAVRLWPGATAEEGEVLPWWMAGRSEWMFEREWRIPARLLAVGFSITEVAFLVVPSFDDLKAWVSELSITNAVLSKVIASMRYVVIDKSGIIESNGVRQRGASKLLKAPERNPYS